MERTVPVIVLLVITVIGVVSPRPDNYETEIDSSKNNKAYGSQPNVLWFGPRPGRKKRNLRPNNSYQNSDMEKEQLNALINALQDSPWTILAVNEGKRHTVNFTPRLGRDSGEDFGNSAASERWVQDQDASEELLSQRSPPFAPRLGRHMSPYSPRLGRENEKNSIS